MAIAAPITPLRVAEPVPYTDRAPETALAWAYLGFLAQLQTCIRAERATRGVDIYNAADLSRLHASERAWEDLHDRLDAITAMPAQGPRDDALLRVAAVFAALTRIETPGDAAAMGDVFCAAERSFAVRGTDLWTTRVNRMISTSFRMLDTMLALDAYGGGGPDWPPRSARMDGPAPVC
jgi:hypothetical protein